MDEPRWSRMAQRGVLVIAHGSSKPEWVQLVDEAVSRVRLDLPVEIGFLELVPGRAIADAIQSLRRRGVDEIIAVPLFVSSGSTHIEEIGYLLGVISKPRLPFKEKPIPLEIPVHYTPAMDGHPLIGEIVTERARKLSQRPEEEVVVLHRCSVHWGFGKRYTRLCIRTICMRWSAPGAHDIGCWCCHCF
jgi:sirohydrochlorin cobaltochelatase